MGAAEQVRDAARRQREAQEKIRREAERIVQGPNDGTANPTPTR